ncbi:MAG: choice-of-anchor U domain-containing protein, partial [Gammaproteobacteria bacterium]
LDNIDNPAVLQGINGVSDHHLLVAEAGVQLQLGATALAAGQASALVTLADINNFGGTDGGAGVTSKRSSDFPGGLYDFVITGLSEAGQSVQIVLPQSIPLPKAAIYRKYIPGGGWQDFVTNGDNRIASAPGSDGVCPAPGDSSYRNGLHAGDYCIQLTIVDGGGNDTDGIPNGVIRDPGGAEFDSQASGADSSGGGGCTINTSAKMDPIWLFLMLVSAAGFIRQRLR